MTQTEEYLIHIIEKMYRRIKELEEVRRDERARRVEIEHRLRAIFETTQEYCDFLKEVKDDKCE